ncbi:MAG: protein translocase subunit SecF [Halanaerobiaceae bacterium]|jgi:preprotein translocase subunit SecF|nr:protein translocase subunit SecF [Halanaerobiaceae bacterium]
MDIIGKRKIWYTIPSVIIILGFLFIIFRGLNFGLDFQGGTLMEFSFDQHVSNEEVRNILSALGFTQEAAIQQSEEEGIHGVLIRTKELTPQEINQIETALKEEYPSAETLRTDLVGPTVGKELRKNAILALLLASIAMIIYISIRFEFRFAIAAIVALLHDVLVTISFFAILGKEVNTPFIAALLTIIGYSINDTIVIFDRLRENMKLLPRVPFDEQANRSINETLPRTINTSITTLIVVLAIYLFGGASVKTFMLALLIGILAGTYSSICIASSLLVSWNNWSSAKAKK